MKGLALTLALSWIAAVPPAAQAARQSIEVRVRLRRAQPQIEVSGFALQITPPTNFISIEAPPVGLAKARIERKRKGVWSVKFDGQPAQKIQAEQLWVK